RRSGTRRRLPILVVLLLIAVGGLTYRAKHGKSRAAEIAPPTPPAVSTQAEQPNKPAEKTDKTEGADQTEKPDQSAAAIQALVNDQLRKAGINPDNPSDVSGVVGKHSGHPDASKKGSSGGQPGKAILKIASSPPGAQIEIDGTDSGEVTPAMISTSKGEHRIVLKFPGFKPAAVVAKVEEGQSFNYAPRLTPIGVPDSFAAFSRMPDIAAIQRQGQEQARQAQRFRQLR